MTDPILPDNENNYNVLDEIGDMIDSGLLALLDTEAETGSKPCCHECQRPSPGGKCPYCGTAKLGVA